MNGEKGVPLFIIPTPAVLRGCVRWRCGFIWNSRCDQGLSVSYSLASKSGEMLTSRDVRASVPKYIFRDTSHYQLLLFVEEANLALGWCTMFVSRGLPTVHEWWPSALGRRRTGVPLFTVSQNGCRTLHARVRKPQPHWNFAVKRTCGEKRHALPGAATHGFETWWRTSLRFRKRRSEAVSESLY